MGIPPKFIKSTIKKGSPDKVRIKKVCAIFFVFNLLIFGIRTMLIESTKINMQIKKKENAKPLKTPETRLISKKKKRRASTENRRDMDSVNKLIIFRWRILKNDKTTYGIVQNRAKINIFEKK